MSRTIGAPQRMEGLLLLGVQVQPMKVINTIVMRDGKVVEIDPDPEMYGELLRNTIRGSHEVD